MGVGVSLSIHLRTKNNSLARYSYTMFGMEEWPRMESSSQHFIPFIMFGGDKLKLEIYSPITSFPGRECKIHSLAKPVEWPFQHKLE